MSIKSRLTESVKKMQPLLEDALGIELGKQRLIPIIPAVFEQYLKVALEKDFPKRFGPWLLLKSVEEGLKHELKNVMLTTSYGIGYSLNPLKREWFNGDEKTDYITCHELTHKAHYEILKGTSLAGKEPFWLSEGFADYMATKLSSKVNGVQLDSIPLRYPEERRKFEKILGKRGISLDNPKKLVELVKELSSNHGIH